MSIVVQNVSKSYKDQVAVYPSSFEINKGEIVGFLGPNGAGKSTMMKVITGYLTDFEGEVTVNGMDIRTQRLECQKVIGYLPEHNPLYLEMYVKEYLSFHARIHDCAKEAIRAIIDKVGLSAMAHKKIKALSKGYRQRVGIAAALLHAPDIVILDEPTTGLDPNQLEDIRALIREIGKEKTVLFSSHILQEVEAVCDRILVLNKGVLVADQRLDVEQKEKQRLQVSFDVSVSLDQLQTIAGVEKIVHLKGNQYQFTFQDNKDYREVVFDYAKASNLKIMELTAVKNSLEEVFKDLTH